MLEDIAMALFEHWQRNVGESAKMDWTSSMSDGLRGTFIGQAQAALDAIEGGQIDTDI